MQDDDRLLSRFHDVLVDEIRTRRPELLTEPFTVAEIYQTLIPYRTHRDRLGVEMNGDYEHVLLRLLAGEGGYLLVQSDTAREQMQSELERSNPNTGLFRDFAAVDVRLNPEHLETGQGEGEEKDEGEEEPPPLPGTVSVEDAVVPPGGVGVSGAEELSGSSTVPVESLAPMEEAGAGGAGEGGESGRAGAAAGVDESGEAGSGFPDEVADVGAGDPDVARGAAAVGEAAVLPPGGGGRRGISPASGGSPGREATGGSPASGTDSGQATCRWCRADLPAREDLNYCPFCGTDVSVVPCPDCGQELEPEWMFCISCGTEVPKD